MGISKQTIQDFLKDKSVIVVGNSESLLKNNHTDFIESFDVIVRMNRGVPHIHTGSRTDIWVCNYKRLSAMPVDFKKMKPKYILRYNGSKVIKEMNSKLLIESSRKELLDQFRINKKVPSTGTRTIDFLLNIIGLDEVHIIGFDFFNTGTWYRNGPKHGPKHEGKLEKAYITSDSRIKVH